MEIKFDHVSFSYSKNASKALNDINLIFNKNEIVFIMGRSGSGKSTLVQHLNGLLLCDEGSVIININDDKFILNTKYTF